MTICVVLKDVLVASRIPFNIISISKLYAEKQISVLLNEYSAIFCRYKLISPIDLSPPRPSLSTTIYEEFLSRIVLSFLWVPKLKCSRLFLRVPVEKWIILGHFLWTPDNLYSFKLHTTIFSNILLPVSQIYSSYSNVPIGMC